MDEPSKKTNISTACVSDHLLCFSLTDSEAAAEFLFPLLTGLGGFLRKGINTE